jgi:hypothetical protein
VEKFSSTFKSNYKLALPSTPDNIDFVGVDLGHPDSVRTSSGEGFSGDQVKRIREHYPTESY